MFKPVHSRLFLIAVASLVLSACSSQSNLPETSPEGLVLVKGTRVDAAYKAPNADFSSFDRVYISEVEVAFRKNWLKDQNDDHRRPSKRLTQEDADEIRALLAEEFTRIFTEELRNGGFTVYTEGDAVEPGEDLLALRPAILDLDVNAPDTHSPGRGRTYTTSAGSMTLVLEFYDSVTGALLGRVADNQESRDSSYIQISNSVMNKAEADRMLRRWARMLVDRMQEIHGK